MSGRVAVCAVAQIKNEPDIWYQRFQGMLFDCFESIISQTGALVYQYENLEIRGTEKLNVDLGQKASGIYQLFVKGKNSLISKKIIAN